MKLPTQTGVDDFINSVTKREESMSEQFKPTPKLINEHLRDIIVELEDFNVNETNNVITIVVDVRNQMFSVYVVSLESTKFRKFYARGDSKLIEENT